MHYNENCKSKMDKGWRERAGTGIQNDAEENCRTVMHGPSQTLTVSESATETSVYEVQIPAEIDVKAIRGRLGLTQQEFAIRFGFSINTLRHWEQGRRVPEAPTRAYLLVIDREPQAVEKALRVP